MKTTVSLPDELFERAEALASRLQISRSELYARALAKFLARRDGDSIAERLNEVYSKERAQVDEALNRGQFASIGKERW